MAFSLYASTGSTTTQLNDGSPFRLESFEGGAGAEVVRLQQHGPLQSGATDLGFRVQPRTVTLKLLFYATTASQLDTYRQQLMAAFKPLEGVATFLSAQRDDSAIRTMTCYTTDDITIDVVPEEYPGHLHRATVTLRAPTPFWKANSVTQGSVDFITNQSWWLAGGNIAEANVKAHYDNPTVSSSYTPFSGNITGDWSVAFVTKKDVIASGTQAYVFDNNTTGLSNTGTAAFSGVNSTQYRYAGTLTTSEIWPTTTDYNYHVVESRSGTQFWRYWNSGTITGWATASVDIPLKGGGQWAIGTDWFSSTKNWAHPILRFAIFGTVTINQLQALGPYILGTPNGTVTVVNDGDINAYPIINLSGPLTNPVIVNTTTSSTIDLTGLTLGTTDFVTIDLRDGDKRIYNTTTGSTIYGSVTTFPISLAKFAIAPAPVAAGGTNTITVSYGTAGTATTFAIEHTNQYMSF